MSGILQALGDSYLPPATVFAWLAVQLALSTVATVLAARALPRGPRGESWTRASLVALGAGVASFLVLWLHAGPLRVHADTVRDLLLSRSCSQAGACPTRGAPTSLGIVYQGGQWPDVVAALDAAGVGFEGLRAAVALAQAGAAALLALAAARWLGVHAALVAAAVELAGLLVSGDHIVVWNPSLAPLPVAAAVVAFVATAAARRAWLLVALGWLAGISTCFHVAHALLIVAALLVATLSVSWPIGAVALTLCAAFAPSVPLSQGALARNAQALLELSPFALGRVVALGVVALAAADLARPRWLRLAAHTRMLAVLAGLPALIAAGLALGPAREWRYAAAAVPAAALLGGWALAAAWGRVPAEWLRRVRLVPAGLAVLTVAVAWVGAPRRASPWRFEDVRAVAAAVRDEARGVTWASLYGRLAAPWCQDLYEGLSLEFAPQGRGGRIEAPAWRVDGLPGGEPRDLRLVPLDAWLDWDAATWCLRWGANLRCVEMGKGASWSHRPVRPRAAQELAQRSYPHVDIRPPHLDARPRLQRVLVPVRGVEAGKRYRVHVFATGPGPCPWEFVEVQRAQRPSGRAGAFEVAASTGPPLVVFERRTGPACSDNLRPEWATLPCAAIETVPAR